RRRARSTDGGGRGVQHGGADPADPTELRRGRRLPLRVPGRKEWAPRLRSARAHRWDGVLRHGSVRPRGGRGGGAPSDRRRLRGRWFSVVLAVRGGPGRSALVAVRWSRCAGRSALVGLVWRSARRLVFVLGRVRGRAARKGWFLVNRFFGQ